MQLLSVSHYHVLSILRGLTERTLLTRGEISLSFAKNPSFASINLWYLTEQPDLERSSSWCREFGIRLISDLCLVLSTTTMTAFEICLVFCVFNCAVILSFIRLMFDSASASFLDYVINIQQANNNRHIYLPNCEELIDVDWRRNGNEPESFWSVPITINGSIWSLAKWFIVLTSVQASLVNHHSLSFEESSSRSTNWDRIDCGLTEHLNCHVHSTPSCLSLASACVPPYRWKSMFFSSFQSSKS